MNERPLRTSVIGSYPFPGWLEYSARNLGEFGSADLQEMQEDAALVAIGDQVGAGLDVITDGEQTRFDFNLSFYGFIEGIALEPASPRRFGPPAHDQRGKHEIVGELRAPRGLGAVDEFERLRKLAKKIGSKARLRVWYRARRQNAAAASVCKPSHTYQALAITYRCCGPASSRLAGISTHCSGKTMSAQRCRLWA